MKKGYFHEIIFSRLVLVIFLIMIFAIMGFAKQGSINGVFNNQLKIILPNGKIVLAEVADTVEKRTKGLSGRDRLNNNSAMLFIFDKENYHSFWTPNMNFALDIVWLDSDYRIVDVAKNVQPMSNEPLNKLPRYVNQIPARYVLEFNAGFCEEYNLVNGDYVKLMS